MKLIEQNSYDFELIRRNGAIYVDKTAYLHALIASPVNRLYFFSRPRRFGKSLMLSTLKCIFEGRKELFDSLAISKTDYDWKPYPVMMLDMTAVRAESVEMIKKALNDLVAKLAGQLSLSVELTPSPAVSFERLWTEIEKTEKQVVVLVDEYDVPLQGYLGDPAAFNAVRQIMHDFYVRLKSHSGSIRFLMMTGVTKLAKLSVFSGLNNPTDLTMDRRCAGLLGYTHDELRKYFAEHIESFAEEEGISSEDVVRNLLDRYDNYRFAPKSDVKVLNPVSVGCSLVSHELENYWSETGMPTLVIEALRRANAWPADLENISATRTQLDVCVAPELPVVPLLYQSGYLTIKSVDGRVLKLGIPNAEVRETIISGHLDSLIGDKDGSAFITASIEAAQDLVAGNLDGTLARFRAAIADLPYEWLIRDEGAVKVAFLDFFLVMPHSHVTAERQVSNGRIDVVVDLPGHIYIFEFKYDKSAQEAFDQITANGYHKAFLASGKPITGIGLNFNPAPGSRGIDPAVIGEISPSL